MTNPDPSPMSDKGYDREEKHFAKIEAEKLKALREKSASSNKDQDSQDDKGTPAQSSEGD